MERGDFGYDLFLFLHILCAIVGFGSTFVWPALASRARQLPPDKGYAITHANLATSLVLTRPFIWAVGLTGVVLVYIYGNTIDDMGEAFGDAWVTIAFVLFIVAVLISEFVHMPNLRAMDALQERLVSGQAAPPSGGGPPPQVVELQARGKRAGMLGGILHLLFVLLLIDMIWKPGAPTGF